MEFDGIYYNGWMDIMIEKLHLRQWMVILSVLQHLTEIFYNLRWGKRKYEDSACVPIYGRTLKPTDDDKTDKVTAGETASVYDTVQRSLSCTLLMHLMHLFMQYATVTECRMEAMTYCTQFSQVHW